MHKSFCLLIIFLCPIFICCGNSDEFVPGNIYDSVACVEKPEQYYALYLPLNYSVKNKYPVVFFFDPSARGKLPLEKYKYIADSLHVILAGSNISKNGPVEISTLAANYMIADVRGRIKNLDESAILLAGFSGGSRFAYSYNLIHKEIKGVIGCGASLPGFAENVFPPSFNYVLIAGFSDFNFREMYQVKEIFRQNSEPVCFIPFQGKHEWPDSSSFMTALLYQLSISGNEPDLEKYAAFYGVQRNLIHDFRKSENLMAAKWCMENLFEIEYEIKKKSTYLDSLTRLSMSSDFHRHSILFTKSLRMEDSLTQEITKASGLFVQFIRNPETVIKPFDWWEKEIGKFTVLECDSNIYNQLVGKRLKSQICIQLWEINRKLVGSGKYEKSLESAKILALANPDEPIYLALKAESLTALNRMNDATNEINLALQKGYSFEEPSLKNNPFLLKLIKTEN